MTVSRWVVWLSVLVAALAVVSSLAGLLAQGGDGAFVFTTVRGETVQVYGQGLYRYEIVRDGTGYKGIDVFTLVVAVPLLLYFTWLYRRGSLRGGLLLTSTLGYFLYNSASMTFGYAYNNFFLAYLAQFTASLFAFIVAFTAFNLQELPAHFSNRLPRRAIAGFLFVIGVSLILVWVGLDILPALLQGKSPALVGHTTLPTHALDVGVIAVSAFLAGVLLLRRNGIGYLLASVILILGAVLGLAVMALSAAQILAGVLTAAQTLAFVVPFVVLTVFSLWCTVVLLRNCSEKVVLPTPN